MKYVEVKEFTPATGKEYMADSYPGLGLFMDKFGTMRIVYKLNGATVACVLELSPLLVQASEPELQTNVIHQGVSVNDLLKVIAVTQQPTLAKELAK